MNRKLPRRAFLHLAAGTLALPAVSRFARAQSYPSRPVRWLVGAPPGGSLDIVARLMGQWLADRLGQAFVIENRIGAAGIVAAEAVARAPADGHTLFLVPVSMAVNPSVYAKLSYDFFRDIAPVGSMVRLPLVMEVNLSMPVRSVPEFIAYAKAPSLPSPVGGGASGRGLSYGSAGSGTSLHLCAELFKMMTGVNLLHVPYRGGAPALTDLLGGQIHVMFDILPGSIETIRAGKVRPLAVTTAERSRALPDIPTVGEFLPGYEASTWFGIGAPKQTPVAVIERLNREINAGLADPTLKARLEDLGAITFGGSPSDFGNFIAAETEKWAGVVKYAGIKPE